VSGSSEAARLPLERPDESLYDDQIVKLFLWATVVWGVVGMLVGAILALQLAWWPANLGLPWTSFGRLRPLHTNAVIFAFGGNICFTGIYYSLQRLLKTRIDDHGNTVPDPDIDRGEASDIITEFKQLNQSLRRAVEAALLPAGLKGYERVIPNRFAKDCKFCGVNVPTGEGYAASTGRGWITICPLCAQLTGNVTIVGAVNRISALGAAGKRLWVVHLEAGQTLIDLTVHDGLILLATQGHRGAVDGELARPLRTTHVLALRPPPPACESLRPALSGRRRRHCCRA
jgi:hypothetical protein